MKQSLLSRADSHTRIKLCEFESLDAAYEACQIGADALGFHLFKHQPVESKTEKFVEIFHYLPGHVHRVLLTDLDLDVLLRVVLPVLPIDAIQLYPDWELEQILRLRDSLAPGVSILKVMSARPDENFAADDSEFLAYYSEAVDGILLDSFRVGGTGQTADWNHCRNIVEQSPLPVFLAGGLTVNNVDTAISAVRPFGVDVETGVSDRIPGGPLVKNMAKCRDFIAAVRMSDRKIGRG